jgi:hypothetical protein
MIGALVTLPLPDGPAPECGLDELHRRLFEQHRIEVPVVHWPRPGRRWVRVSAQLHNDLEDYRALAQLFRKQSLRSDPVVFMLCASAPSPPSRTPTSGVQLQKITTQRSSFEKTTFNRHARPDAWFLVRSHRRCRYRNSWV